MSNGATAALVEPYVQLPLPSEEFQEAAVEAALASDLHMAAVCAAELAAGCSLDTAMAEARRVWASAIKTWEEVMADKNLAEAISFYCQIVPRGSRLCLAITVTDWTADVWCPDIVLDPGDARRIMPARYQAALFLHNVVSNSVG